MPIANIIACYKVQDSRKILKSTIVAIINFF